MTPETKYIVVHRFAGALVTKDVFSDNKERALPFESALDAVEGIRQVFGEEGLGTSDVRVVPHVFAATN